MAAEARHRSDRWTPGTVAHPALRNNNKLEGYYIELRVHLENFVCTNSDIVNTHKEKPLKSIEKSHNPTGAALYLYQ